MNGIEWIFFDIGSTLVDESKAYEHRFSDSSEKSNVTFEALYQTAVEFYKQGKKGDKEAFKLYNLTPTNWHTEDEFLYPDTIEILKKLSTKYKLGVIANQVMGIEKRLEDFGILEYFKIIVSSAEEGVSKPNEEIFRRALKRADTIAEHSVMVGDRLDNDIIPAKNLGFSTVWIKQGFAIYMPECDDSKIYDFIVYGLNELLNIFL